MPSFNRKIESLIKQHYIDYVGFANLNAYQNELTKLGGHITKGFPNGISLGLLIPNTIVNYLPEGFDFNKCHNYFEDLKKTEKYAVCGLCLYVCPHGNNK